MADAAPLTFHPIFLTVEVVFYAQKGTNQRRNVIHYHYTGSPPTVAELTNLLNDIDTAFFVSNVYPGLVANGTNWYLLTARDCATASGAATSKNISHNSSYGGSSANNSNVSLCLTKRSAYRNRAGMGRFYMIDCPENEFDNDTLNPAFIPGLTILCNTIMATRISGRFVAAIASRRYTSSVPILAMTFDFTADSQRRRLQGRGI